jgi:hypothetical protein
LHNRIKSFGKPSFDKLRMTGVVVCALALLAASPSVADIDAHARASGNRIDVATAIGQRIFATTLPVQVLQVMANDAGGHVIVGMRLSGVKFHEPTAQAQFDREVLTLVQAAFAANPAVEEVDLWVTVPITVGKGLVVSGDLAKPTTRTVFTVSVRRGEPLSVLEARLRAGTNVFIEPEWAATAFTKR